MTFPKYLRRTKFPVVGKKMYPSLNCSLNLLKRFNPMIPSTWNMLSVLSNGSGNIP